MIVKQISIFIENKPGRLAEITDIIARNNINMSALSLAEREDYGILRIIVNNPEESEQILKQNDIVVSLTDVISVLVEDKAGALAKMLQLLADNNIAIEYMYAFALKEREKACMVMRIKEYAEAAEILQKAGYTSA